MPSYREEAQAGVSGASTACASHDAQGPTPCCLHELVSTQASRTPDAVAVVHGSKTLTYAELERKSNQFARYLLRRAALESNPRVGIALNRSIELPVALLGTLKAGGSCIPLDPAYPAPRLGGMLRDSKPRFLLAELDSCPALDAAGIETISLRSSQDVIARENEDYPPVDVPGDVVAYIIYTSGSTGQPRGVLLPHAGLVNHAIYAADLFHLRQTDRVLQFSSLSFDIAIEEMFPAWMSGAAVVFRPPDMALTGRSFLNWLEQNEISVLDIPTAFWHELVADVSESGSGLPECLRLVVVGGEKASAAAWRKWTSLAGNRVRWINTYGPTETSVVASAYEPGQGEVWEEIPLGRPIANTRIYILDPDFNPVPARMTGELFIAGPGVAKGYLNRPDLTDQKFLKDPFAPGKMFRTGDLGCLRSDGLIEFRGRNDDQVKIRGFRVEPGEVESVLQKHPEVREAAVVALKAQDGTDVRLAACYVPARKDATDVSQLRAFVGSKLPEYMVPAIFLSYEVLPHTPNGKVDRSALTALAMETQQEPGSTNILQHPLTSSDQAEEALIPLWEKVLGVRGISTHDNFFELGGHSLLAIRLLARMEKVVGRAISLTELLQAPTISQIAALLRAGDSGQPRSYLVPMQPLGARPPFFCVHGMGGAVLRFRALARAMQPVQPFYALQAPGVDGECVCPHRVEEFAAKYVPEILKAQPNGPYYVGGYSFGGLVAWEIAQQLERAGKPVEAVVLIDTFSPHKDGEPSLLARLLALSLPEQVRYVSRKIVKKTKRLIKRYSLTPALQQVRQACARAERDYRPQPYYGRVLLFRSDALLLRNEKSADAGWSKYALGPLQTRLLSGDHGDIIDHPKASVIAEAITRLTDPSDPENSSASPLMRSSLCTSQS